MVVQKLEWQAFDRLARTQKGPEVSHKTDLSIRQTAPRLVNTERANERASERERVSEFG